MTGRHRTKAAAVETGPDIREAWVDAPLTTWAQYLHELDSGSARAGRERVQMDRRTLMGGFCRFHGTQAQEQAMARFKAIYERSQVGGAKAVDPSKEPVDGGGINPESVIEIGADARRTYNRLWKALGAEAIRKVEFVVIGEHGPTAYARWRYRDRNPDGRAVSKGQVEVREVAELMAVELGLQNLKRA